ncbi:MAG: hypothetical protein CMB56_000620 [Methanobacteriota archaeon]|nr:MAG: hypothetical protein CMB56_000620 [Euryarchaeota archaeon]|tara:strand:- start:5507 stop:6541 length:1035 start_codon:yes stop_codon:yes gene_type:complete
MKRNLKNDDSALSDVIGMVMLLAMIVIVLSSTMIILQPYISDFDDNKHWSQTKVIADQVDERIRLVGASPQDTGSIQTFELSSTSIKELDSAEVWIISADVSGTDVVEINLDSFNSFNIKSINKTPSHAIVNNGGEISNYEINFQEDVVNINFEKNIDRLLIIEILNADSEVIHKFVRIELSGIEIDTTLSNGKFKVDLLNGARLERLHGEAYKVDRYPSIRHSSLPDSNQQLSYVLIDIDMGLLQPSPDSFSLQMISKGPLTLFEGDIRNIRMIMNNEIDDSMTERYFSHWMESYNLNLASGTLDDFEGFGPWKSVSGIDGFGIHPLDKSVLTEIVLHRVVVI